MKKYIDYLRATENNKAFIYMLNGRFVCETAKSKRGVKISTYTFTKCGLTEKQATCWLSEVTGLDENSASKMLRGEDVPVEIEVDDWEIAESF